MDHEWNVRPLSELQIYSIPMITLAASPIISLLAAGQKTALLSSLSNVVLALKRSLLRQAIRVQQVRLILPSTTFGSLSEILLEKTVVAYLSCSGNAGVRRCLHTILILFTVISTTKGGLCAVRRLGVRGESVCLPNLIHM